MGNKFGLLGRKLGHSWSPQIHKLLCGYEYSLYEVEPENLGEFLQTTDLDGMNVTIPYKKDVVPYCTSLSPAAQSIGSVNTLVKTPDGWHGDNTDYAGFVTMTKACSLSVAGKKTLVFGTGGASLAVLAALRDMGADPIVSISRTGEDNYENLSRHSDGQILVNATPLGMYPNTGVSPVELDTFPRCQGVLDVVYNPLRTKLLLDAEQRHIPCQGGLTMLVAQARRSAEQFAQAEIADQQVAEIVATLERQMENIVLVGMPGCGKTTIGLALAQALGRPFVDADSVIEERSGMTIPAIFQAEGEEGFRRRETAVLADLGKASGTVIATGGGCVTRPENYPLLHQNGHIVWIQRDLSCLPSDGRPLSQRHSAQTLYDQRKGLYEAFADLTMETREQPEQVVAALTALFS
jgi:shikimate dehydrogenase